MSKERSRKISLDFPISWDGGSATEIVLRRPKVRMLKDINSATEAASDDFDAGIATISILSGLPVEAIEDMDASDFEKVSGVVEDFFPQAKAPANGAPSSPKPPTS